MKPFFLPGGLVANFLSATQPGDRAMIRTLIDMLFWNVVAVGALVIFL
jgi:hypothetical protein